MGLEFTRGSNARCPPFLVGGLMIMCLFFLCSWWSLSSQNFELLRHNDNLAEQLKINGEELRKCQDCQNKVAEQEAQIRQIKDSDQELQLQCQNQEKELSETKKREDSALREKDLCHTEVESLKKVGESKDKTLETLRTEKNSLEIALDEKKKRITELENKLAKYETQANEDKKLPIAKLLEKKVKMNNNENSGKEKVSQNHVPSAKLQNPESELLHDENNAGEVRNDQIAEPGDPREEEMGMNANDEEN